MKVILASQSPYRRAQLENFGLSFEAVRPLCDEESLKKSGPRDLEELTRYLAFEKAKSLAATYPGCLLIGSDQLAECDGDRLDKPGTVEQAEKQLRKLSGKEHRLITSLVLLFNERKFTATDVTRIRLKELSPEIISAYIAQDMPLDCAGSYKIEKAGMGLVASIESHDPSAIQGLPLLNLSRGLDELGLSLAQLWRKT